MKIIFLIVVVVGGGGGGGGGGGAAAVAVMVADLRFCFGRRNTGSVRIHTTESGVISQITCTICGGNDGE